MLADQSPAGKAGLITGSSRRQTVQNVNNLLDSVQNPRRSAQQESPVKCSREHQVATWVSLKNKGLVHEEPDSPKASDWMREFSHLTPEQLATGLRRVNRHTGFFNLPAFIDLCTRVDFQEIGLPSTEQAFQEACKNAHSLANATWSHPAVYHAGADVGWFEMARAAYRGPEWFEFEQAYHQRSKQAQANTLPPIPSVELLPQGIKRKASEETRQEYLKKIYAMW